jgi:hypothetical protein
MPISYHLAMKNVRMEAYYIANLACCEIVYANSPDEARALSTLPRIRIVREATADEIDLHAYPVNESAK